MSGFFKKISETDTRSILAILCTLGSFGYIFALMFKAIPQENKEILNIFGGALISATVTVWSYYFGSSKKDRTTTKQ